MSTIREVAKEAQVSIATVSRILSNDPTFHASEETRQRVMQAVHTLNYQYASRRNQIHIGCIMSLTYSYSDPYFNDILNGIQSFCSRHNALISLIVSYAQFQEMKAGLEKQLSELDGLIITDLPVGRLDFISRINQKLVFIDNYINGYCNVGYNEIFANQIMMDHLISCGYRKIAYIGGPADYYGFASSARMMVYRETLRKNNIPFNEELIYDCNWDHQLCARQTRELLSRHPDTHVIFAGSDSLAIVILSQLNELGLKCPDDIGVVGFNDIDLASSFSPPLTTVRLPPVAMGETAARILIEQITTNTIQNLQILLPVELKVRKSTRNICNETSLKQK